MSAAAAAPTLLVVDDEPYVLETVSEIASQAGFHVVTAASGGAGIRASREQRADLAMVDLKMPDVGGLDVLRAIHDSDPRCQMILMTGHASVETAVEAIKIGAMDYLSKPLDVRRVEQLLSTVREEVERRQRLEIEQLARQRECFGMIGTGAAMQHLFGAIRRLAPFIRTALISGETGTGKELVARALHKAGRRADKRFVTINCSAVVETLFESELFGHVRGAFTGATETKPGLFEVADGGVLFLDEVGELPLGVQAKLLRVLELGEVHRVGSLEARRVDVQVLAATNRDLRIEVAAGRFRRDLFYRLNIVEIRLPALRERAEDVPPLASVFVRDCATRWNKSLTGLTDAALAMLVEARWDGNIRELRNVIERACLLADGTLVGEKDLAPCMPPVTPPTAQEASAPPAAHGPSHAGTGHDDLDPPLLSTVEREHILRALQHARGNKKAAARMLGVSRRALYRRLERLGLDSTISRRTPTGEPGDPPAADGTEPHDDPSDDSMPGAVD
jgi:DNA-binding NtrC family response regulator